MRCEAFTENDKRCNRKVLEGKYCWQHGEVKERCSEYLRQKIRKNITEFNESKNFTTKQQAIAVAYQQTKTKYPDCNKVFSPKNKSSKVKSFSRIDDKDTRYNDAGFLRTKSLSKKSKSLSKKSKSMSKKSKSKSRSKKSKSKSKN